jgi:CheY-like chemotaxis protein/curved DNA-binding protein CbpA
MSTKVMIVDDNNDIRNLLATWLKQVGYDVLLADDGAAALDMFSREKPKLLFLDMLLPKKNGIEVCKEIKMDPDGAKTPIVLMTAVYKGMQYALEAKKSGADVYIEKPFQNEKILEITHKLIGPPEVEITDEVSFIETKAGDREITLEGNMSGASLPVLLVTINKKKLTGELRLRYGTAAKSIFFLSGRPLYSASNQISDRLGITVLKQGLISKDQYDEAVRLMQQSNGSVKIGQALIRLGFLTDYELTFTLREQYKKILISLFQWTEGDYAFLKSDNIIEQNDALNIPLNDLILQGLEESYTFIRVEKEIGNLDTIFMATPTGMESLQTGKIKEKYKKAFGLIDGTKTLRQIMNDDPEKGEENVMAVYALYICGYLAIKEVRSFDTEQGEAHSITPEMIIKKFKDLPDQNYYQILGVDSKASTNDIKKAYFRLAKLYHPDKFRGDDYKDLRKSIDEIFNKISQAHKVLTSVSKRTEYEKSMSTPKEDQETVQKFTRVRNAELRFIEGKAAFQRGRFDDAMEALKWAIELNPEESEYYRLMGQIYMSKYLPSQPEFLKADEFLKKSIKLRNNDPENYFFYGQFKKRIGDHDGAFTNFKKAIEFRPGYHEAIREVRLYEMRADKQKKKGGR